MRWALVLALAVLVVACGRSGGEVVVFAAASTIDVAEQVAARVEAERGGRVVVSAAASSTLARQIAEGAPADVFLSADPTWVDWLAERGVGGDRAVLASGRLVWVEPAGTPPRGSLTEAVAAAQRAAMGDPTHVPVGTYGREALTEAGLWDAVQSRVVPQADARAALAAVETGAADAALVFASDALASRRVTVTVAVPYSGRVRYEGLALTEAGRAVLAALGDEAGRAAWRQHGFEAAP